MDDGDEVGGPTEVDGAVDGLAEGVADLVPRAAAGDAAAWEEIVARYAGLVAGIAHRYGLPAADLRDVSQTVWLRCVEHLAGLREPRALPAWLVATTRHECLRVLRGSRRVVASDGVGEQVVADEVDLAAGVEEELLAAQRRAALRAAFSTLPPRWRELLELLLADPPLPYVQISDRLQIPVGSIGPTRARCLERLRNSPSLLALRTPEGA